MKSLVVYYTRTGKTKSVAEAIAAQLGADLEEVVDLKKRGGAIGWISGGKDASRNNLTEIAPTQKAPADYDLVIVGTPIWAWSPTPAIHTYISKNDLSGKRVALFYTFGSSMKQAGEKVKELLGNATVVGELPLANLVGKEEAEKKIAEWCQTLKQ